MADLRAGDVGAIRLTEGLPPTLRFVDVVDIFGTSVWAATVAGVAVSTVVDGADVVVSFPADASAGRFVLSGAGSPQFVGRVVVGPYGTDSPDGTVTVVATEPVVTVTVVTGDPAQLAALDARVTAVEADDAGDDAATAQVAADLVTEQDARAAADALLIPLTQRGAADGVATLDGSGLVPDVQIPAGITRDSELSSAISAAIDALLDGAPGALNTLNELAAAVGDDADFAGTVVAALSAKADLDAANVVPATWRAALALGTAAQSNAVDFDAAGAAAAAQAAAVQRANHTGVQAISTVTGLQSTLDEKVATATAPSTAWVEVAVNAPWVNTAGFEVVRYRKWLGLVVMQGIVQNPTGGSISNSIFTLPAGFRPRASLVLFSGLSHLRINSDGTVGPNASIASLGFVGTTVVFLPE